VLRNTQGLVVHTEPLRVLLADVAAAADDREVPAMDVAGEVEEEEQNHTYSKQCHQKVHKRIAKHVFSSLAELPNE